MYVIDRFEGSYAVCEERGGGMVDVPRALLPELASEGDCIYELEGSYVIDETYALRKSELKDRFKRLSSKG